jgi:scyllo-inositol 2-dehydrogenase (NADP+)
MTPIKTALCSFGMSGKVFHAPFIDAHPDFELYGVFERSKELARQKYPRIRTFRSLEEMLADEAVDLVIVNTPNATHYDFARKALAAGKHVVVEKPFTTEVSEGEELISLAAEKDRVLAVYQNRRWDSDFLTVRRIINDGLVGDVVEAELHFDRYKEELSPKLHKETPGPGAGILYDLGSHLIDQALQLFGMPAAVFADIAVMRPASKVDDYFELLLYYPRRRVRLKATYVAKEPVPAYIIHGSKGTFLKSRADVQELSLQGGQPPTAKHWGKEPDTEMGLLNTSIGEKETREKIKSQPGDYMQFYDQLHRAITTGEAPPVTAIDGLNVVRVIHAAFTSSAERRVVEV